MISERFTPTIHRFDLVDSTNRKARELALDGASEGTVIVARSQTKGKGQAGREWFSPEGGLHLSVLLYPRASKSLLDLPILAGVAMAQAVRDLLPKSMVISLKWPNDCLLNWKKVGGILCESFGEEATGLCVAGLGLNVNVSSENLTPFVQNPFSATSFMVELGGGEFSIEKTEQILLSKLFTLYKEYQKEGSEPIRYLWEKNCRLLGKKVQLSEVGWRRETFKKMGPGVTIGTLLGLDELGGIVLENSKGERRTYHNGEITCYWP